MGILRVLFVKKTADRIRMEGTACDLASSFMVIGRMQWQRRIMQWHSLRPAARRCWWKMRCWQRLELDVYSFNPSAEKVYLKAGFKIEGVLRDAVRNGEEYADDILMSMLEEEWKAIKEKA